MAVKRSPDGAAAAVAAPPPASQAGPPAPAAKKQRDGISRKRKGELKRLAFAAPAGLFLLTFFVYPLFLMIDTAMRDVSLGTVARGDNEFVGFENFQRALTSPDFLPAVPRTIAFVVVAVVLQVSAGIALALILNSKMRGVQIGRSLIMSVWLLPPVVSGAVWRFMLSGTDQGVVNAMLLRLGLIDSPIVFLTQSFVAMALITFVVAWAFVPFATIVFMAALQNVPPDVEEAAHVDGATPGRRFLHVTLPFLRPTITIMGLLLLIYSFKSFDFIFVLTQGGPGTSTATVPYLAYLQSFSLFDFGLGSATGVIAVLAALAMAAPYLAHARREEQDQ